MSKTRSQQMAAEVAALLRARNPLIWIKSREETRVEMYLFQAAAAANYVPRTWDCAAGVCGMDGKPQPIGSADLRDTLDAIREAATTTGVGSRGAWIMRDLPPWLNVGLGDKRRVRNLTRIISEADREHAQAMIVLTPDGAVPPELSDIATVIEWPMPDRDEIADRLDAAIEPLSDEKQAKALPASAREAAIDAAVGLSGEEASACYAKSLVMLSKVDPLEVAKEKKRVIAREGTLEWVEPLPGGLNAVGGLDQLKDWLVKRKLAFTPEGRAYGLPAPKGAFFGGVSGCGKSLTAKAISTAWGWPLLKGDLGGVKSKFVGESEAKLRNMFQTVDAVGRCILWFDEVEKSLAGATDGAADGGVSNDALGYILTWMQERKSEAFVIMTANNTDKLPPELLRKGRFDELWFIDLPTQVERVQILNAALKAHGRSFETLEAERIGELCMACEGFTGAEMAAMVPEALFNSFADGARELNIDDLLGIAEKLVPLSKTAPEKMSAIRQWGATNARRATSAETGMESGSRRRVRQVDL